MVGGTSNQWPVPSIFSCHHLHLIILAWTVILPLLLQLSWAIIGNHGIRIKVGGDINTRILHPWAGWRTPLATPNIKLRVIVPFLRLWKCSPVHAIVYIDCWNAINRWMATAIGRTPLTLLTCQKVVVFFGTFVCTSKGYVERETSLSLITCQKVVFFWQFCLHQ